MYYQPTSPGLTYPRRDMALSSSMATDSPEDAAKASLLRQFDSNPSFARPLQTRERLAPLARGLGATNLREGLCRYWEWISLLQGGDADVVLREVWKQESGAGAVLYQLWLGDAAASASLGGQDGGCLVRQMQGSPGGQRLVLQGVWHAGERRAACASTAFAASPGSEMGTAGTTTRGQTGRGRTFVWPTTGSGISSGSCSAACPAETSRRGAEEGERQFPGLVGSAVAAYRYRRRWVLRVPLLCEPGGRLGAQAGGTGTRPRGYGSETSSLWSAR